MKNLVLGAALLITASSAFAQGHFLQVDDGAGHYSVLKGQTTNAVDNFQLPAGGGVLLTSGAIPTFAWALGGNTGIGGSNQLGTLDNTPINFVTGSGGPNTRMSISQTGVVTIGSGGQFSVNNSGNITKINNVAYSFPSSQGTSNQVLVNDGSGNLSWSNSTATLNTSVDNTYTGAGSLLGNTNNLLLSPSASYFRLNNGTGGPIDLTGINNAGIPDGHLVIITNIGTQPIVLKNDNSGSSAGNRFDLNPGGDIILGHNSAATLVYDAASTFWKVVSTY